MAKSFRIISIKGPVGTGPINSNYEFYVNFEYNLGEPNLNRNGSIVVRLKDAEANTIAIGDIENSPYKEVAIERVAVLVSRRLSSLISSSTPELGQSISITPTTGEILELRNRNRERFQPNVWIQIPS